FTLAIGQYDEQGNETFSKQVTISGHKIYFEGVVVYFQTEQVAQGQSNVHLLLRTFSDSVPPGEGVSLLDEQLKVADQRVSGEVPTLDSSKRQEILTFIRHVAQDPAFAKAQGVRAVNTQASSDLD